MWPLFKKLELNEQRYRNEKESQKEKRKIQTGYKGHCRQYPSRAALRSCLGLARRPDLQKRFTRRLHHLNSGIASAIKIRSGFALYSQGKKAH